MTINTLQLYERLPSKQVDDSTVIVVSHLLAEGLPVFLGWLLGVVLKETRLLISRLLLILLVEDLQQPTQKLLGVLLIVSHHEGEFLLYFSLEVLIVTITVRVFKVAVGLGDWLGVDAHWQLQHIE